nr:immunoglobulin heavy chain junction region [Macaca mulatta]
CASGGIQSLFDFW